MHKVKCRKCGWTSEPFLDINVAKAEGLRHRNSYGPEHNFDPISSGLFSKILYNLKKLF